MVRLERFFAAHAAVSAALRATLGKAEPDQKAAWSPATADTPEAATEFYRCVRMTAAEAQALLRMAMPPAARTIPSRKEHAFLFLAMAQLLDELAAIDAEQVPYSAITAAQHLAVQVRDWLVHNNHVVMGRMDKLSDSTVGRPRFPDALNRRAEKPPVATTKKELTYNVQALPLSWHNGACAPPRLTDAETFPWGERTPCPTT
jgi:hypothetical protein